MVFRMKTPKPAEVLVTAGKEAKVVLFEYPEWTEFEVPMPFKTRGMQDLKIELVSGQDVEIDWITFR